MATAIITGSGGLIGSESVHHFVEGGSDVIGLENDMRARFFGPSASTRPVTERLQERYPEFRSVELDIRDAEGVERVREGDGSRACHPYRRPALPRLGRFGPEDRFRGQRPQLARGDAAPCTGSDVHFLLDQQVLR